MTCVTVERSVRTTCTVPVCTAAAALTGWPASRALVTTNTPPLDTAATATTSVSPARYGPRNRAAATPMTAPAAAAAPTPAESDTGSVHGVAAPNRFCTSATVYAPTAISAPCPRESCPFSPVRTVRPAAAHRYAPAVASW